MLDIPGNTPKNNEDVPEIEKNTTEEQRSKTNKPPSLSKAEQVLSNNNDILYVFKTKRDGGSAYAVVLKNDVRTLLPIPSPDLSAHISTKYHERTRHWASKKTLEEVMYHLEMETRAKNRIEPVFNRIAHVDGVVYVDLADGEGHVVEITRNGWQVVPCPINLNMVHYPGNLSLPFPERGGDIHNLLKVINIREKDLPLVVGWIVACYMPKGPYLILVVNGEQGSAKTALAKLIRNLVDPKDIPLGTPPKNTDDLWHEALTSWVYGVDNVSQVPDWMSDDFCRLVTGAGNTTRKFYSQGEQFRFEAIRPVLINGIGDPGTRADFLDRAIIVTCPVIPSNKRREEHSDEQGKLGIFEEFDQLWPSLMGCIFDGVSKALGDKIKLANLPRMADFTRWAATGLPALEISTEDFLRAYNENRGDINALALEQTPLADTLLRFISLHEDEMRNGWKIAPGDLLFQLDALADIKTRRDKWPKSPAALSAAITRMSPNLRRLGINITIGDREREPGSRKQARYTYIQLLPDTKNIDEIRRIISLSPRDAVLDKIHEDRVNEVTMETKGDDQESIKRQE